MILYGCAFLNGYAARAGKQYCRFTVIAMTRRCVAKTHNAARISRVRVFIQPHEYLRLPQFFFLERTRLNTPVLYDSLPFLKN